MIAFDPSPWLLLTMPFLAMAAYVSWRGFVRNEFRVRGKWPWEKYRTGSPDWYMATLINLTFLVAGLFMLYQSVFHGTDFSREPELPMPVVTGAPIKTVSVRARPDALARCLADLDHGQIFELNNAGRRVVVRNGRNDVMYVFDIVSDGSASLMKIYRLSPTPFVSWDGCVVGQR